MDNEVIIEENKIVENKNFNKKAMLTYAICGFVISAVVIVVAILYFVKVMPRSIAMHIMYPGISVNLLINGFSMLKYGDKKIAKVDFIVSAVVFVIYIIMFVVSLFN